MEITIQGTEEELRAVDKMIDRVALTAGGNNLFIQMDLHEPTIISGDKASKAATKTVPKLVKTQKVYVAKQTSKAYDAMGKAYDAMGKGAKTYLTCLYNAGPVGKTQLALMRCLGIQKIGPVRGAINSVTKNHGLTMDDLVEVTVRRNKERFALTKAFSKIVHDREVLEAIEK